MHSFPLRDEHITLARVLKAAGLAESGGQAKLLVREGLALVNDAPETRPARKLYPGDRFRLADGEEWVVVR